MTPRAWARLGGSIALAAGIGAFGLWRLDLDPSVVAAELLRAQPLLLGSALMAYYSSMPLRALRWRIFLEASADLSAPRLPGLLGLVRIYLLGWLVNCLLPAKAGELYRTYLLRQESGARLSTTFGTVIAERAADLLALTSLLLVSGALVFGTRLATTARDWVTLATLLALAVIAFLCCIFSLRDNILRRLPAMVRETFWGLRQGVFGGVERWPQVTVLTAAIWSLEGVRFFAAAKAVGVSLPLATALFAALVASLLTTVPLTPAGVGVVEAGVVGLLLLVGVTESLALSVALLDRLVAYWSVLLVGPLFWLFTRWKRLQHGADRA
jgi:uncharacterized membrane protein YbhN (UPF0104 family)